MVLLEQNSNPNLQISLSFPSKNYVLKFSTLSNLKVFLWNNLEPHKLILIKVLLLINFELKAEYL